MQTVTDLLPEDPLSTCTPYTPEEGDGGAGGSDFAEKEPPSGKEEPEKEEKVSKKDLKALKKELEAAKKALTDAEGRQKEQEDKYLRMLAEYDNFRRRAKEEKDGAYALAAADVLTAILPVLDNLERAAAALGDAEGVRQGVQMTLNQFTAALDRLGITEVPYDRFDPTIHNAVMHIEDGEKGEGEIVEVLQKGYKKGDKIIRYAMVKVAN